MGYFRAISAQNNTIWLVTALIIATYFLTAKGYLQTGDTSYSIRTAESILFKGSLSINGNSDEVGGITSNKPIVIASTQGYSKYGIGLPILFIPLVAMARIVSSMLHVSYDLLLGFLISFLNIFFATAACFVFFRIVLLFEASFRLAVFMTMVLGLGTIIWHYALFDYSEMSQLFFLICSLLFLIRQQDNDVLIGSLIYAFLMLLKITYVIYMPLLFVYLLFAKQNRFKKSISYISICFTALFILLYLNYYRWGYIFYFGYPPNSIQLTKEILNRISSIIFSVDYGIFIYSPILITGILGFFYFLKRYFKIGILITSIVIANLCFHSLLFYWKGEWAYGARFTVPIIPLVLLPAIFLLNRNKIWKYLGISLFILSFFIQLGGVLVSATEYDRIKRKLTPVEYRGKMPGDLVGAFVILKHRLIKGDNIYTLKEFGVNSDKIIDTTSFRQYQGFNLWYCYLARIFNKPIFNCVPMIFLPLIVIISIIILRNLFPHTIQLDK